MTFIKTLMMYLMMAAGQPVDVERPPIEVVSNPEEKPEVRAERGEKDEDEEEAPTYSMITFDWSKKISNGL